MNEFKLHGRCGHLVWTGIVFALAAFVVAGLPPAGPFLGKSGVEDAAAKLGYEWVLPFVIVVSALTGGALSCTPDAGFEIEVDGILQIRRC